MKSLRKQLSYPEDLNRSQKLIAEVARVYRMAPAVLASPNRSDEISFVRWIAIRLIFLHTGLNATQIGRLFNRTPGAISRALKGFESRLQQDPEGRTKFLNLQQDLLKSL
jgi:chromosomal replication initiation ATPase DnaA